MEKEQLDSLATLAVGSEKIPPSPHSHYAPSESYSSESPPAYSRASMKSTAVQITRVIATTLIAVALIIGSCILASAWLQARTTCTPATIAGISSQQHREMFKHLQPEALTQIQPEAKSFHRTFDFVEPSKDSLSDSKEMKVQKENNDVSKPDTESGDGNENDNDDDYEEPEYTPVHIKLPIQLDVDDLAGTLMQQAKNLVSCVVERRQHDEIPEGENAPKNPKRSNERVSIICESIDRRRQGDSSAGQQEQEMSTPIIVPIDPIHVAIQPEERDYNRYQSDFMNPRSNIIRRMFPSLPKNFPQLMDPQTQETPSHQLVGLRPIPIELRRIPFEMIDGMRPPLDMSRVIQHVRQQQQKRQQNVQQMQSIMRPPPPLMAFREQSHESVSNQPLVIHAQIESKIPELEDRPESSEILPFDFQQIPSEIKNIIQQISDETKQMTKIPKGARREVEDFKPFPEVRSISLASLMLPIGVPNVPDRKNTQNHRQEGMDENQEQSSSETDERKIPADIRTFIHQIVGNRAIPISHFSMDMRPLESLEIPLGQKKIEHPQIDEQISQQAFEQPILNPTPEQRSAQTLHEFKQVEAEQKHEKVQRLYKNEEHSGGTTRLLPVTEVHL